MPIYWLNGAPIADDYADFYDGVWSNENRGKDESGGTTGNNQPWTGSDDDGTEYIDSDDESHAVGTDYPRSGGLNDYTATPLSRKNDYAAHIFTQHLYAISPVFVPTEDLQYLDDSTDNSNLGAIRVSENWPFVPSEIEIGVPFRLIFLTSDRTAGSSQNDSDYNRFVQDAAAGHTAIHPYSDQFTAVVSTNADNARDNTSTTGTGVPIYWLNGAKAAYNYGDFYNGTWTDEAHRKDETGNPNTRTQAWTGSDDDGTEFVDPNTSDSHAVGTANPRVGKFNVADPEGPLILQSRL